jgi:hypothetical protein
MKRAWILSLSFLLVFSSVFAGEKDKPVPTSVYLRIGQHDWSEDARGKRFMNESGLISAAGIEGTIFSNKSFSVAGSAEIWGGLVDYDGTNIMPGSSYYRPLKMKGHYIGLKADFDVYVYAFDVNGISFNSFTGVNGNVWNRSSSAEHWSVIYPRAGMTASRTLSLGKRVFARVGVAYPLASVYASNEKIGSADVKSKPGGLISFFAEFGLSFKNGNKLSFAYDALRLTNSKTIPLQRLYDNTLGSWQQPQVRSHTIWFKFGRAF